MLSSFLILVSMFMSLITNAATPPNFIFILTDDQDVTLDSMRALPNTFKYLSTEGLTFNNTFISTPICCPARAETIAGRNYQNVINQPGPKCMHCAAQYNVFNNSDSMFQLFQSNGYLTANFGKLTNDMNSFWCNSAPQLTGFSRIHCPCNFNDFYGQQYFDKYMNGTTNLYKLPVVQTTYQTSLIGNASMDWLLERMQDPSKPFLMWIGPHAPHYPATPAAWYADRFSDIVAPETPNYNQSDPNKHSFVGTNPYLTHNASVWIDQLYRDRLRSLLSVDDLVSDIVTLLQQYPAQFANTYILFTSDNGYHLGQYDVPCSKQQPYEETIRIPMYMTGPNVPKGKVTLDMVGNIDILPTFLSLAGIGYEVDTYDGMTWTEGILNGVDVYDTGVLEGATDWRTSWLTQYQSVGTYGFSHCETWVPAANGSVCPGQKQRPPETNAAGRAWIVDNVTTNNWRAIRIMNDTTNIMYAEFVNSWDEHGFNEPYFYEYYDIKNDPFQLTNSYDKLASNLQQELHSMLMEYGNCTGSDCW